MTHTALDPYHGTHDRLLITYGVQSVLTEKIFALVEGNMKIRIIKWIIRWLMKYHKYLMFDAVIPTGYHIQGNPQRGKKK